MQDKDFSPVLLIALAVLLIVTSLRLIASSTERRELEQELQDAQVLLEVSEKGSDYYKQRYFNLLQEGDFNE